MNPDRLARVRRGLLRRLASCALLLLLGAVPAGATRVVDLRLGLHEDHTRVVIELDKPGGHRIERADGPTYTLRVALDANAERRQIVSQGPLVWAVTLEPEKAGAGAVAQIQLREPGLEYSEMVLDSPPRLVIDVRRPRVAASQGLRQAIGVDALREAGPTLAVKPGVEAAPETGEPKPAAAEQPESAPLPATGPVEASPPASAAAPTELSMPATAAAPDQAPMPVSGGLREDAPAMSMLLPTPIPPVPAASLEVPAPSPNPAESEPSPGGSVRVLSDAPREARAPAAVESLAAWLRSRLSGAEAAVPLLVVAILLAVWIFYRRLAVVRTRRLALEAPESGAELEPGVLHVEAAPSPSVSGAAPAPPAPTSAADVVATPPASAPRTEVVGLPSATARRGRAPATSPEPAPLRAGAEAAGAGETKARSTNETNEAGAWEATRTTRREEPPAIAQAPEPAPARWQTLEVPAAPSLPEDALSRLESRISRLETQLEQLLEGREKMERLAAAQIEELRVQRAAIARTQRLLRDSAPGEESPRSDRPERVSVPPPASG